MSETSPDIAAHTSANHSAGTAQPVLDVRGVSAWYGEARVLTDVSLSVSPGEVVTLVGRNGAGKTTLLRSVMGLHRQVEGVIRLDGRELDRTSPDSRAKAGIGWVPDDRGIYASLTVSENLTLPPVVNKDAWSLEQVYEQFPVLHERRDFPGTKLSGGEQQMLAMARVLRMGSRLLLLDEPSEGLAPVIVQRIGEIIREIKAQGVSVLLVEQNVKFASTVADRHYLLAQGRVVESLDNEAFQSRTTELLEYLGM
ncbi:MAG TPA: ABC transporter ATP-binding protein [Pedococcus sp.]|nr:ABC transporter ATP-binding protein [Pedococcus sp.]